MNVLNISTEDEPSYIFWAEIITNFLHIKQDNKRVFTIVIFYL